jgi:organic hydroperoxide reductase OsmC/OhrA
MSAHVVSVQWERNNQAFTDRRYSRRHTWTFDGGAVVAGSSSPHVVPVPASDPTAVDPEEAFVASIASCHMLWFLDLAAQAGWMVDDYRDDATGVMTRDAGGKQAITTVTLHPRVSISGPNRPDLAALTNAHHRAHEACFIANSVKTEIRCEPVLL